MMKNINKALYDFQDSVPVITKNRNVSFKNTNYNYADLESIMKVVQPLLRKQGLMINQQLNGTGITTCLSHLESGEYIEATAEIPKIDLPTMNQAQSAGSAITYFRRYAIVTILGLTTEDDTDTQEIPRSGSPAQTSNPNFVQKPWLNEGTPEYGEAEEALKLGATDLNELREKWAINRKTADYFTEIQVGKGEL